MSGIALPKVVAGLDLGDKFSRLCLLGPDGAVLEEARVATTPTALHLRFAALPSSRIVLEAATHSPWVSRLLAELGHEVLVANPRRVRLIYGSDDKADPVDAESLARLGRLDPTLLSPIQHRGPEAQRDLALLRARDVLVASRTALVNHVRSAVKGVGARLPVCSTPSFPTKVRAHIPEELLPTLEPLLETLVELNRRIRTYDREITRLAEERYPETRLLMQVGGVGPLTALAFVLTLEDPLRFSSSRSVGAFLGMRPRRRQSGSSDPNLRITKAGSPLMRRLLVGSAHYILGPFGPDCDLRRWGLELARRGGPAGKKRAAVAVARRLAVLLHRLWLTGEVYEPLRNARTKEEQSAA